MADPKAHRIVAIWLSRLRLNDVRSKGTFIEKRRRRAAELLLAPGNLLTQKRSVPLRVLSESAWHRRELEVGPALGRRVSLEPGGWLRMERAEGAIVAEALRRSPREDLSLEMIRAAALALRELHRLDFDGEPLSHGDATVRNVTVAESRRRATWFDFDAQHLDGRSTPAERRADDLRALIFSAAAHLRGPFDAAHLAENAIEAYGDAEALIALAALVSRDDLSHDLWHLAQCSGLSPAGHSACREAILALAPRIAGFGSGMRAGTR